jgi:hypothetical protein
MLFESLFNAALKAFMHNSGSFLIDSFATAMLSDYDCGILFDDIPAVEDTPFQIAPVCAPSVTPRKT